MAHGAIGRKNLEKKGCENDWLYKIFHTAGRGHGKNCSENTMKKMPKMLKGCSPKKPSGHE
jgi:hypothetical protein